MSNIIRYCVDQPIISRGNRPTTTARWNLKWFTEFGHLNRGDMLTSEQHRCSNEKKKFQSWIQTRIRSTGTWPELHRCRRSQRYGCRPFHNDAMGEAVAWWATGKNTKSLPHYPGTNWNPWAQEKTTTFWNGKWNIKKGYRAFDVRLPEQFSIIGKLRARYPVATLCHVFGVHRSSYKYWKNRPEKPDGRRTVLRSQVLELHCISHGLAGAMSIATMATQRGYQMGRWLAGRLMK